MKRNAQLFAVMLGLGVAGWAWAAPKARGAVGPAVFNAVRTQKAVGPRVEIWPAVRTQKTVGPRIEIVPAVRTQKTVGPRIEIIEAVRTQKAVGPRIEIVPAVRTQKTVAHDEQGAGNSALLDLNAGF